MNLPEMEEIVCRLNEMKKDGLIQLENKRLTVTERGRAFVRNIAMAFDLRLLRSKPDSRIFSMTV
jgi:oxygen-independent coproporphyrinogen-3 oxidase